MFPSELVMDPAVVKDIRDQVKFAMATIAMNRQNYREALSSFASLYKPEASYFSGLVCWVVASFPCVVQILAVFRKVSVVHLYAIKLRQ